ncbi:DUF418 domain-containing protein [Oceanobacillus massiliensis]|uniref:DUF418 domain-containing protein n=1 Tax=Oceanobacillus massiliensis TaxID=1465765 RepID=UPI000289A182|nr:DUF418 domain-containing protein [Oceanobacillus massiliensis]
MNSEMIPTRENKRLVWIDAARGFAIFGIFMVNIGAFSAPYFIQGGAADAWSTPLDKVTQAFIDIFFQASFYTLFSILFGFGIQLLKDRLKERHVQAVPFLFRRLLVLIGFGLIHAFGIWHGDILLSYGLIGLLLLLFLNVRDDYLLIWGGILLGGSVGLLSLALFSARNYLGGYDAAAISQAMESYRSSNLVTIWMQNYQDWMYSNGGIGFLFLITTLLPLFLFGMYLARKGWLHEPEKHKSILLRVWRLSLLAFILLKIGPYLFGNPIWFSYIQDNIGGTASATFYIVSFALLAISKNGMKLIQPFAPVGRMALSNYLFQSAVSFILFYGIGFGLYGTIRPIEGIIIVLLLFIIQVLFSRWWFTKYRFGPMEWIWRSLTYNKVQPLRKRTVQRREHE